MKTDLSELTTAELRAVRDDRSAITDEVYRIIEQPLNEFGLRSTIFRFLSSITADAFTETLNRLPSTTTEETSP